MELTVLPEWLAADASRLLKMGDRMPHALLLHGQAGLGKHLLARTLARGLLCESADQALRDSGGCGACAACLWFSQHSHPDFRVVTSEALAAASGLETAEDGEPDEVVGAPRGKRGPSKEIKVDQIRALHGFMSVATHRNGFRVVLLDPLDAVNDIAANALLKMLEEPPPRSVFILIGQHLGRVPATIVSRCQKVFVAMPAKPVALAWLASQRVADAEASLALSGGAPFAALALSKDDDALAAHRALIGFLLDPGREAALATADRFGKAAPAPLIRWIQLWIADCISARLAGSIRYHPAEASPIERLAGGARIDALMTLMQRVDWIRRAVDHPLNTRLLLEGLLLDYCEAIATTSAA